MAEDKPTPSPDAPENETATPRDSASPVPTLLEEFSEPFISSLKPVLSPVEEAQEAVSKTVANSRLRAILPGLRDLRHNIQALIDKVAEQHAYVLIFGPLKSGKSTFMNAMCASYVSEVSALPAYPCLVHVSHSDSPSFIVTRYDGQTQTFTSQDELHDEVLKAHPMLTERIREIEEQGEAFDPSLHMPDAIRKIDVKLPTGDLAQSGAVLVDTPGLYSRMKFGYDRMTRDFRDAAACAIFVVKSDNLFLEQVFDEFHELLELFSRIFLIVNVDSRKKDLQPDGSLVPSLEHEDPEKLIRAFTDLAMSAPLKAAAEDGRLQIFPVDLLDGASRRIKQKQGDADAEEGSAPPPAGQVSFDDLLVDLTDFLNSSDYLHMFLADSIRRSRSLLGDLKGLTEHESIRDLESRMEQSRREHGDATRKQDALQGLKEVDWRAETTPLRDTLIQSVKDTGEDIRRSTQHTLTGAIESWFDQDAGLTELLENDVREALSHARERLQDYIRSELKNRIQDTPTGLNVSAERAREFEAADLSLSAFCRKALEEMDLEAPELNIDTERLVENTPVRRRFADWCLFRGRRSVRQKLFGDPANPGRSLTASQKERRLGDAGLEAMRTNVAEQFEEGWKNLTTDHPDRLLQNFADQLGRLLGEKINREIQDVQTKLANLDREIQDVESVHSRIKALAQQVEDCRGGIESLAGDLAGRGLPIDMTARDELPEATPLEEDLPETDEPPAGDHTESD